MRLLLWTAVWSAACADNDLASVGLVSSLGLTAPEVDFLTDQYGQTYSLADAQPYTDLFSPEDFEIVGSTATSYATGETFVIPIARAVYENGDVLQILRNDDGLIDYAEIRCRNATDDTFFIQHEQGLLRFTAEDLDQDQLQQHYGYGEAVIPDESTNRVRSRQMADGFVYRRGDGTSSECRLFKTIDLAIVYDAEFCQKLGSLAAARNRILAIVASASLYYERDMCVKLRLTALIGDPTCRGPSPTFASFRRDKPCGTSPPHMLSDFSSWIKAKRGSLGIRSTALVHYFTGYPPSSIIGCAWRGTLCWNAYSYGVEYMTFGGSNIVTQGIVLAHEIGHNLNAQHYDSGSGEYIMEAKISKGTDGFSAVSVNTIMTFLDLPRITCDGLIPAPNGPSQPRTTPAPTPRPVAKPTPRPVVAPTPRPVAKPTPRPVVAPTSKEPDCRPTTPSNDGDSTSCGDTETTPNLCVGEGKKDLFVCLAAADVIQSFSGQISGTTVAFKTCNGGDMTVENIFMSGRGLKKDKDKNKKEDDENSTPTEDADGLKEFEADDCGRSCVMVGDYLCLLAKKDSVHDFSFVAEDKSGTSKIFETSVEVKKGGKDSDRCFEATTQCRD